ncbi:MAG: hypothetical protein AAFO70_05215, partial [Pseudomonadota bacterium]
MADMVRFPEWISQSLSPRHVRTVKHHQTPRGPLTIYSDLTQPPCGSVENLMKNLNVARRAMQAAGTTRATAGQTSSAYPASAGSEARMAKTPQTKSQAAAADSALDAVEEALRIDFLEEAEADKSSAADASPKQVEPSPVVAPAAVADNDTARGGSARFRASLNQRPSRTPIVVALLLSIIWIAAACWAGYRSIGPILLDIDAWRTVLDRPAFIYFLGSLILPLFLIWAYAVMARRAGELKVAARSMTEAAYRLIEPETEAVGTVRSISLAVRSEVNALTDGIDRAVNRASELETLVQSEVAGLETSYAENEGRLRSLVAELSAEREAIIEHSERVRSSISGASDTLREDLTLSARQISDNVEEAQQAFTAALTATNDKMRSSLEAAGEQMLSGLEDSSNAIAGRLDRSGD